MDPANQNIRSIIISLHLQLFVHILDSIVILTNVNVHLSTVKGDLCFNMRGGGVVKLQFFIKENSRLFPRSVIE